MDTDGPGGGSRSGLDATLHPNVFSSRDIKRALLQWEQGHVLAGVPVYWAAPNGHDEITKLTTDEDHEEADVTDRAAYTRPRLSVTLWDEVDVAVDPDVAARSVMSDTGWAIVTSQTCDIQATGPGERHTHVQVSPVVQLGGQMSAERLKVAKAGMVLELVHLPQFEEDGEWFADLRISLPVSKGVLVGRTPRRAFATTGMANEFSERVAAKIRRPALHDAVDDPLRRTLRETIRQAVDSHKDWPDEVEQFRIQVTVGDRLRPKEVHIWVICFTCLSPADRADLKEWKRSVTRNFRRQTDGCELRVRFTTVDRLSVRDYRDYRDSVFMHVPELGGIAFW